MQISLGTTLRSRVARRLLVLFLFAALLPAIGMALIAYFQVSGMLIDMTNQRLQQDAKNIGMNLVQRLIWRENSLQFQLANQISHSLDSHAKKIFSSIEIVKQAEFANLSLEQQGHLNRSKVLMQLLPDGQAFMSLAIKDSADYLRVKLNEELLWEDEYEGGDYCVLTLAGQALYCSPGMPVPNASSWATEEEEQNRGGIFEWTVRGEDHLASFWRIPLQASLAHEGLVVVVSYGKADALRVLNQFKQIFPAIAMLAMALAIWLAITQIRRQMNPLDRLERHTKQLALGNFANHVEIEGDDEFASLAESFNRMSDHLNHKFHLLKALAELDRAILGVSKIESVILLLLQHLPASVPCDQAAVLRFNPDGNILVWTIDTKVGDLQSDKPILRSRKVFLFLDRDVPWFMLNLSKPEAQDLLTFVGEDATQCIVFPARINTHLDSLLVLAYRQPLEEIDEIIQAGRSLTDRLAAAALSISWEDKLYHQAHFDALTDLPNRTLLRDRVEQALLRAQRENFAVALLLIDLDKFKDVNDSLGHGAGDTLLVSCAQKLKKIARHTDTVARLGGDEFVVLIPDLPRVGVVTIVDRIVNGLSVELAKPVDLGPGSASVPASIGIALYPDNGTNIEELMVNADAAMYESKRQQFGGYRFYSDQMNVEIRQRFDMLQDLRKALDNNEFYLVYQPKIDAETGRVVGAEALIRWASPQRGLVSPAQFIHLLEEIGMECRLGEWVIEMACAQMAAWDAQGFPPISVSVNASPAQFRSNEIVAQVETALSRHALDANRLELEILESTAITESGNVNETLETLRSMQVGIALDDFGTGYSSLVYLTRLPANVLKIDRGFIIDFLRDERKQVIVRQIISLAKALDFTVVAEGVEEEAQARILKTMGCDIFQGYLFSKPLESVDFLAFQKESIFKI